MTAANALLTDRDRRRLGALLSARDAVGLGAPRSRFQLELKLDEAQCVPSELAPCTLVTMNSKVRLIDLATGHCFERTLVYPEDRDLFPGSVSVLQDLGRRMLGRRQGEVIRVDDLGKTRWYKIAAIVYQPEDAGALNL